MAANTFTQQFIDGASSTTQATAKAAFATALAAVTTYQSGPITILNSGAVMNSTSDGATTRYMYWAFVQYFSAS